MKVVITGPTGAIGMALISQCIKQNIEVLAICHKHSARTLQIPQNPLVKIWELDLDEYAKQVYEEKVFGDFSALNSAMGAGVLAANSGKNAEKTDEEEHRYSLVNPSLNGLQYDVFIHLAWNGTTGSARNDTKLQLQNQKNALDAVKLARALGCQTFIGAGSQAEYGRVEGKLSADTPAFPENGYGISKLASGQMTRLLCNQLGMKHIWLRILSIYGPYDGAKTMVMNTISQLMQGERVQFTKGEQLWDYLYSEDAAKAILLLAEKGLDGKVYPIGSGQARPLKEYIETIAKEINNYVNQSGKPIKYKTVLGDGRKVEYVIGDVLELLEIGALPYADKQVMHLEADIRELKEDTRFTVETSFEEGIQAIIGAMQS